MPFEEWKRIYNRVILDYPDLKKYDDIPFETWLWLKEKGHKGLEYIEKEIPGFIEHAKKRVSSEM